MGDHHHRSIADRELPDDVADRFAIALDLPEPPRTYGDWIEATGRRLADAGLSLDADALCLTDDSPHRATVDGETHHFRCVLDALLVPFVLDPEGPIDVRSRSPVAGAVVEGRVSEAGISVTPADAVMSFGIARELEPPESVDATVAEYGYRAFCPYINAFADDAEYATWAAETSEAATTSLPLADGFELAERLARRLTDT